MLSLYIGPRNYVTGRGILNKIGEEVKKIAESVVLLYDKNVAEIEKNIEEYLNKSGIKYSAVEFGGECSYPEIERISEIVKAGNFDAIAGVGGGKIMDTVKAVGFSAKVKSITIPTNAATCAAWSSHSAIYTETGTAYEYFNFNKNADLLFLDKEVVAKAPVRHLIAGIADTIAKWIETDVSSKKIVNKNTEVEIAVFLAKKCYEDMEKYGEKAVNDVKNGIYTDEVDKTIETIIITAGLVGGIGGEACRAVASHAVNNGFTVIPSRYKNCMHGESVGFGNIVQLFLDNKEMEYIQNIINLYKRIGIPLSMEEFGYNDLSEDELDKIVNRSIYKNDTMSNLPYNITFEKVKEAFLKAEETLKGK